MSEQEPPRRTSRRTQGIPPARFETLAAKMPTQRSPSQDTPTRGNQTQQPNATVSTPSAIPTNPPAQQLPPLKMPENKSPASTTKPSNEVIEFRKQIDLLQRQMQAMQKEFMTSTKTLQSQLLNTTQQLQTQLSSLQPTQPMPPPQQPMPPPQQPTPPLPQSTPILLLPQPTPPLPQPTPPLSQPTSSLHQSTSSRGSEISGQTPYSYNSTMPHKKIYPLPIFTGLPEEWHTFFEAFDSTTAEFGYSSLHNIMRLREALKGRARDTVESLLSSSANVNDIMEILKETFGRPEQLIRSQIEKVRAISPLTQDNLEALVNFANKISNMTTFLKNVKGEHHLSNPSLLSELVSKLPTSRQMQWAEKSLLLERPATVIDFSNWLAVLRRLANIVSDTLPSSSSRRPPIFTAPKSRKYACVGVAVGSSCAICQGECVSIQKCSNFLQMPLNERWHKVKQVRACFCCLSQGHQLKSCNSRRKCGISDCPKSHHRLLHNHNITTSTTQPPPQRQATTEPRNTTKNTPDSQPIPTERRNCHAAATTDSVLFQILPVTLYGKHKTISTYAFVDDGANVTMLDRNIAHELEIRGKPENLELQWLNEHTINTKTEKIDLTLSGNGRKDKRFTISNVYLSADLSLPIQSCHISRFCSSGDCNKIPKVSMQDYTNVQPKLILSLNHSLLTVPLEVPRMLTESGPIISITRLGAIVYGPNPGDQSASKKRALPIQGRGEEENDALRELNKMMREYFDVETLGIKANAKQLISKDDERALRILKDNIRKIDGRYECALLWKENVPPIPNSYQMALNRLYSVERKMAKDKEYSVQYCEKIKDYLDKGYARKLTQAEKEQQFDRTFYLPHFGVKNVNKKGIRLVFDAAAEIHQFSLNKALLSGPDINKSLISILFKFREAPIAVCGDIQEMFHQIAIAKEDQDSQRFLWRNGNVTQPVEIYVMERMIFGATCSPTIAQYVKNYNANQYAKESPRAVHGIIDRHYVDDYVDCFQSEEEAVRVVQDVIRIHKAGGFNLRNIISNSDRVRNECGHPLIDDEDCGEFLRHDNLERVLGIHWSSNTDVFRFLLKLHKVSDDILNCRRIPTKREMLSLNMSIYDPFGFICDFMVTSKVLMQKVWKAGVNWDENLPTEIYAQWKTWLEELPKLLNFAVPRCYFKNFMSCPVDLHVFVDASEEAMAVVAYWRVVSNEEVKVSFVMGKTSCAPTRYHTTPKLELQAAVMGVRMKGLILENHLKNVNTISFWTDSYTVIQWIRSDHRMYKQYVANRVSEILDGSEMNEWRWCPGQENPADEATRANFSQNYQADGRWKNGPNFLMLDSSQWPQESSIGKKVDRSDSELRSKHRVLLTQQVCAVLPKFNRFSKYCRLKRSMAWVWRYQQNLLRKIRGEANISGDLTVNEEIYAEQFLCRHVQQQVFADEFADLQKHGSVATNSVLRTLNPFIDPNNLLRVSGRIENASFLSLESRQPIILPKTHPFTRLLVESYHSKFCHINTATTMSEIRLRFWVPSLRQLLNSIQARCQACRIRRAKPRQPLMAALPAERVTPYVRAFTYTGLDYFGPVTVSIRRKKEKRWVALFTCLSVRAVHLEIATDLSSDACLLCIRNFINRRGVPVRIRSDNGTNFVGIAKELQGVSTFLDTNSIASGVTALGIEWVYNTPANPSEGGVWERLVQSVKKALHIMLKEQSPKLETLQAFLIEAENMVNSRPLTHLPVTPEDPEPLTPNHFLLGCCNSTQTPAPYDHRLMCLRKQWRVVQNLKNGMWRQWIREYLPELTRRTKWCFPSQPLAVGCLVFICDVDVARSHWKRGRVIALHPGKDGVARSAEVKTSTGVYRRPVSKLAILDVGVGAENGEASPTGSVHEGGDVVDGHSINSDNVDNLEKSPKRRLAP